MINLTNGNKRKGNKRQIQILRFIYETVEKRGFPPTVREICSAVNLLSTSTVHGHISRLQRRGLLIKDATKPRALEVTEAGKKLLGVPSTKIPILEKISDLERISADKEPVFNDYFPLPTDLQNYNENLYMLTMPDDSMNKAGIFKTDHLIVRQENSAENGDIIVAKIENDNLTIKRFFKENNHYRLQAENDAIAPIILQEVTILGKVIGLYRNNIN